MLLQKTATSLDRINRILHAVWLAPCLLVLEPAGAPVAPPHVSFGDDASTSVSVNYRTAAQAGSLVNYGTTTAYGQSATGSPFAAAGSYQHHVTITGLEPGTAYFYEVEGSQGSFRTAPDIMQPFRFAVPGDVQYWEAICPAWQACANWLAGQDTKMDFWIPVGDISAKGQMQSTWDYFFRSSESLANHSVLMPVQGNHECTLHGGGHAFPQLYQDNFYCPSNGNEQYRSLWYSFEYGEALFIVLLNHYMVSTYFAETVNMQKEWLEQLLTNNTKRWTFVVYHDPNIPNSWRDLLLNHKVTTIFNGHTHSHSTGYLGESFEYTTAASFAQGAQLIAVVDVSSTTTDITTYNYNNGSIHSTKTIEADITEVKQKVTSKLAEDFKVTLRKSLLHIAGNASGSVQGAVSLHDARGRMLHRVPLAQQQMVVDLRTLGIETGTYILRIDAGSFSRAHRITHLGN